MFSYLYKEWENLDVLIKETFKKRIGVVMKTKTGNICDMLIRKYLIMQETGGLAEGDAVPRNLRKLQRWHRGVLFLFI